MICPIEGPGYRCGAKAHYVADYGAPGVGQYWECDHGHALSKIGPYIYDARQGAHLQETYYE